MHLTNPFSSYTARFMAGYVAFLSLGVFLILLAAYAWLSVPYYKSVDDSILNELDTVSAIYQEQGIDAAADYFQFGPTPERLSRFLYLIADNDRKPILGNLDQWPEEGMFELDWWEATMNLSRPQATDGRTDLLAHYKEMPSGHFILVARHVGDLRSGARLAGVTLLWSMLATILLGLIGAAIIGSLTDRRINAISRTLRGIMSGSLSDRIKYQDNNKDMQGLIDNINAMLNRIEDLMSGVRTVADNIAHDLRTPLTRLRSGLSELEAGNVQEHQVDGLLNEADGLLNTFNALLRINQVETGNRRSGFAPVNIKSILLDVIELYEPLAADKNIAIQAPLRMVPDMNGDRDLLFQCCANVIDNAIKYTPEDGDISVSLQAIGEKLRVTVSDNGPGIAKADRENVFNRFYRVESSRHQPGNGLGLSLVRAVARLHGGDVELGDNQPGLIFNMEFDLNPETGS